MSLATLENSHGSVVVNAARRGFGAILNGLTAMSERHALYRQLSALNELSDEDLARKGLTREEAIRQILPGFGIY